MSAQLKAKLKKQKEMSVKKIAIVRSKKAKSTPLPKKEKIVPNFVPSVAILTKRRKEEEQFREKLQKIVNEMKDINDSDQSQENLEDVLKSLIKNDENWGINGFIKKILLLPPKLQEKFVNAYLDTDISYSTFYEKWIESPNIIKKIEKYNTPVNAEPSNIEKMREDLLSRAKQYAEKNGIDIEDSKSYYDILSKISKDKDKIHKKIAKYYIEIAESLNVKDPATLFIADLLDSINRRTQILENKVGKDKTAEIRALSPEKLIHKAQKLGIDDENQEVVFIKILQANIPNERKDRESRDRFNIEMATLEDRRKKASLRIKVIPSEDDKKLLAEKLARITGQSKEEYMKWSPEELQARYQAIEEGEEYWEEFERSKIIDELNALTRRSTDSYRKRSTESLIQELEMINREKTRTTEAFYAKKCVEEFREYKWIKAKVTGVWIAGSPRVIREYTTTDVYISVPGKGKFYQANIRFFNLLCGTNASSRRQEGDIMICIDRDNHPVHFRVGYSIKNGHEYMKKSWPILTAVKMGKPMNVRTDRLLIQDEALFQDEKNYIAEKKRKRWDKIQELLAKSVTIETIKVAKDVLSTVLSRVAPKVKDYEQNSPYINIAIDSVVKDGQTIKELFGIVADLTAYLQLSKAEILHGRIKAEYYLPDILLKLSHEDKLPEIFEDSDEKTQEIFTSYLNTRIAANIIDMAERTIPKDPTARIHYKPSYYTEPNIEPDYKGICVNSTTGIKRENIVYYKDLEDDNVYCFDSEILMEKFRKRNFINPITQRRFDRKFIRRFIITYYDEENSKSYAFKYPVLYKQLKSGDFINSETGRPFTKSFIDRIMNSQDHSGIGANHKKHFAKMDRRLAICRNGDEIIDEPVESVIYYKDPQDGGMYCFTIEKMSDMLEHGAVNPYTERTLSSKFVKKFKRTFSQTLHRKGMNQPEFRAIYGEDVFKGIKLPIEDEPKKMDQEESMNQSRNEALIIPNLWNIISKGFIPSRKDKDENETTDENENEDEDETIDEDEISTDEDDEDWEDEGEDETTTDEDEDGNEDEDEDEDETNKEKIKAVAGFKKVETSLCTHCKKNCSELYKSVIMKNSKPQQCQFCSLKCMENFRFPVSKRNSK